MKNSTVIVPVQYAGPWAVIMVQYAGPWAVIMVQYARPWAVIMAYPEFCIQKIPEKICHPLAT